MNLLPKLKSLEELKGIVGDLHGTGATVVFANGCFDLLHVGHIRYLEAARSLGDCLILGLNSDCSVRHLKGPDRPLMPEAERAELLSALSCVDYLLLFDDSTVDRILLELKPDVHAKGTDYAAETVPERATVLSYGGRVAIVGDPKDHSTREYLKRIAEQR
ncbi:MAG: D-glycero-beta-D-manno-heptose 1-phosphate adenylyltransferase [Acidobacteria bacterium]|nr:MAG: D-glycero-beta-D-manno-heptose 1-phosphate adenylyltransferase [Acidobacteriota bacterium]